MFDKINVIVNTIIFVVYVVAILLNFQMNFNFILTFIFSLITLLLNVYVSLQSNHKNSFNNYPILIATNTLLIFQLITSIVIVYLNFIIPINLALFFQVIILAVHLLLIVFLLPSKHHIEKVEKRYSNYTTFYQNIKTDIDNIISKNNNPDLEKDLKDLKELISYSNPTTSVEVQDIDVMILENIKELKIKINEQTTDKTKELISVISSEIEMRNNILRH